MNKQSNLAESLRTVKEVADFLTPGADGRTTLGQQRLLDGLGAFVRLARDTGMRRTDAERILIALARRAWADEPPFGKSDVE